MGGSCLYQTCELIISFEVRKLWLSRSLSLRLSLTPSLSPSLILSLNLSSSLSPRLSLSLIMIMKETERAKEKKEKQNNNEKKHRKGAHRRSKYSLRGSRRLSNDVLMLSCSKTLRLRYSHHLMLARYRDLVL